MSSTSTTVVQGTNGKKYTLRINPSVGHPDVQAQVLCDILDSDNVKVGGITAIITDEGALALESVFVHEKARGIGIARPAIRETLRVANTRFGPAKRFEVSVMPDDPHMAAALRHLYTDVSKELGFLPVEEDRWKDVGTNFAISSRRFTPSVFQHLVSKQYERALQEATQSEMADVARHEKLVGIAPFSRPPRATVGRGEESGDASRLGLLSDASDGSSTSTRRKRARAQEEDNENSEVASDN